MVLTALFGIAIGLGGGAALIHCSQYDPLAWNSKTAIPFRPMPEMNANKTAESSQKVGQDRKNANKVEKKRAREKEGTSIATCSG